MKSDMTKLTCLMKGKQHKKIECTAKGLLI